MAAIGAGGIGNLHGQLAGGAQYNDARAGGRSPKRAAFCTFAGGGKFGLRLGSSSLTGLQDQCQRRQHEAGGFSAAGAAGDHQVFARQAQRDGTGLHVGGFGVTRVSQRTVQDRVQVQGIKTHHQLSRRHGTPRPAQKRQPKRAASAHSGALRTSRINWKSPCTRSVGKVPREPEQASRSGRRHRRQPDLRPHQSVVQRGATEAGHQRRSEGMNERLHEEAVAAF